MNKNNFNNIISTNRLKHSNICNVNCIKQKHSIVYGLSQLQKHKLDSRIWCKWYYWHFQLSNTALLQKLDIRCNKRNQNALTAIPPLCKVTTNFSHERRTSCSQDLQIPEAWVLRTLCSMNIAISALYFYANVHTFTWTPVKFNRLAETLYQCAMYYSGNNSNNSGPATYDTNR